MASKAQSPEEKSARETALQKAVETHGNLIRETLITDGPGRSAAVVAAAEDYYKFLTGEVEA